MDFEAHKEWEFKHPPEFSNDNITSYHCIKSTMNDFKFIIDLKVKDNYGNIDFIDTYFLGDIREVIKFISENNANSSTLSLISTRRANDGDYSISDIVSIEIGEDSEGQDSYIYHCKDNKIYIDSALANTMCEIKNRKPLYFKHPK